MTERLPSPREPLAYQQNGSLLISPNWYRYFAAIDSASIAILQEQSVSQAASIVSINADIVTLNGAISTVRDVALFNTLTNAAEIPDLGR